MSAKQETIADILREMRGFAEHRDFDSDGNMDVTHLRVFADRIEAAAKRGNAAELRNCDRFKTGGDAMDAWLELDDNDDGALEPFDWLFAPYEYRTPKPALDVVMARPEMKGGAK